MNKVVNVFSIVVLTIFTLMSMVIIFDLSISNFHLKGLPYQAEILSSLAVLFFLLGILRVRRRWQGFKDMKNFSQFAFVSKVSDVHIKRARIFTSLEVLFMLSAMVLFYRLYLIEPDLMIVMLCVLGILAVETIVFLARIKRGAPSFRVGINSRVIAFFGREMYLYYYSGLRRVELHQKDLISFKYKDDLVLFFPANVLDQEDRIPFREELLKQLEQKNIYFDDALRNWK